MPGLPNGPWPPLTTLPCELTCPFPDQLQVTLAIILAIANKALCSAYLTKRIIDGMLVNRTRQAGIVLDLISIIIDTDVCK